MQPQLPLGGEARMLTDIAAIHFLKQGEWPDTQQLRRLAAHKKNDDLFAYVHRGDFSEIGRIDGDNKLVLSIEALAQLTVGQPLIEDFLWLVEHAHVIYMESSGARPQLSSDELRKWPTTDEKIALFYSLLKIEPWIVNGGGGNSPTNWSHGISDTIYYFSDVHTFDEYLAIKTEQFPSMQLPIAPVAAFSPLPPLTNVTVLDVDELHPNIASEVLPRLTSGHVTDAVLIAAKEFAAVLRQRTGLDGKTDKNLDGTELINRAFSVLEQEIHDRDERIQLTATKNLALGAVAAFRNIAAHKRDAFAPAEAMEAIGLFSLLCRRVEEKRHFT